MRKQEECDKKKFLQSRFIVNPRRDKVMSRLNEKETKRAFKEIKEMKIK